jgi:hypothetical protein
MPARKYATATYRFGFNKQERDDEVKGVGNLNSALYWEYDARLGRRWNPDPVIKPWESRYACFANAPIKVIDINGDNGKATITESPAITKGKKTFEGGTKQNPNQITITANYYYGNDVKNNKEVKEGLEAAISTYNNSNETVIGADGKYYNVKFNLKLIPLNESDPHEVKAQALKDFEGDGITSFFSYGNAVGINIPNMEVDGKEIGSASKDQISAQLGNMTQFKEGDDHKITIYNMFMHEIGHNLGGGHEDGGVMTTSNSLTLLSQLSEVSYTYVVKNVLTNHNVEKIVSTIWGGGGIPGRRGQVQAFPNK